MSKLLLLFSLLPLFLAAQPKITRSDAARTALNGAVKGFAREPNTNNLLVLNNRVQPGVALSYNARFHWGIDVFTPDLKLVSTGQEEKINFPDGSRTSSTIMASMGGIPKLLFWQYEKKEKKLRIFGASIEPGGKIGSLKPLGSLAGDLRKLEDEPTCVYSLDSSYLLMMIPIEFSKKSTQISCLVLDRNWKVVREEVLALPVLNAKYFFGKAIINKDASIWLPVLVREENKDISQEIWVWESGKPELTRIDISLSTNFLITSIVLNQSEDMVYAGGLYCIKDKEAQKAIYNPVYPIIVDEQYDGHPAQGTFLIKIDRKAHSILSKNSSRFSEPILKYWERTVEKLERGGGLNNLVARKICLNSDGGAWLCIENYYYLPHINQESPKDRPDGGKDYFGSALFVQYDAENKVVQEFKVGKGLYSYNLEVSGYFFAIQGKNTLMIYNDHKANLDQTNKTNDGAFAVGMSSKPHAVIRYTGYKDGEIKPHEIFNDKEKAGLIRPHAYIEWSPGVFVFPYYRDKDYGLLKVEM